MYTLGRDSGSLPRSLVEPWYAHAELRSASHTLHRYMQRRGPLLFPMFVVLHVHPGVFLIFICRAVASLSVHLCHHTHHHFRVRPSRATWKSTHLWHLWGATHSARATTHLRHHLHHHVRVHAATGVGEGTAHHWYRWSRAHGWHTNTIPRVLRRSRRCRRYS